MTRTILALLSDTHGGHKLGLLNPDVTLYDETEDGKITPLHPALTASQGFLWDIYSEAIVEFARWANGDEVIVLHNGDLTQGVKYPEQLVSTRAADQVLIGAENLKPWLLMANVRTMRLIVGTGSHVLGEGTSEILAAQLLAREYPEHDIQVYYHGLIDVGGLQVDISHHGPNQSSRVWLSGNLARYYLNNMIITDMMGGRTPPGLVVRSHVHTYIDEMMTVDCKPYRIIVTPPLMLMGDHGRQATRSLSHIQVGLVGIEIIDGEIARVRPYLHSLDIRTKERLR